MMQFTRRQAIAAGLGSLFEGRCSASRLLADDAGAPAVQPTDTDTVAQLPGKVYAWASLTIPSGHDAPVEYDGVISIDPNTGNWQKVAPLGPFVRVSPKQSRVAFTKPRQGTREWIADLFVADLRDPQPRKNDDNVSTFAWAPDGKRLAYRLPRKTEKTTWQGPTWIVNLKTLWKEKLPIAETEEVADWSPDGEWLLTVSDRHAPMGSGYQLYLMHTDGGDERRLTEDKALNCYPRFSPNSNQIVYCHQSGGANSLWVVDIDGANRLQMLPQTDDIGIPDAACWSPDGQWLAVRMTDWTLLSGDEKKTPAHRVELVSIDGANRRRLHLRDNPSVKSLQIPDWK